MNTQGHVRVFISYSRKDDVFTKQLERDLQAHHISVWMDTSSIQPGTPDWDIAIRQAIDDATAIVLVATPNIVHSKFAKGELDYARIRNLIIYPVWADGTVWEQCVPIDMSKTQYIDMRQQSYTQGLDDLIKVLTLPQFQFGLGHRSTFSSQRPPVTPAPLPNKRTQKKSLRLLWLVLIAIVAIALCPVMLNIGGTLIGILMSYSYARSAPISSYYPSYPSIPSNTPFTSSNSPTSSNSVTSTDSPATQALKVYCSALLKGDYNTAYYQWSNDSITRRQSTEADYAAQVRDIFSKNGGLKDCQVEQVTTNSHTQASGEINYVFGSGQVSHEYDSLQLQGEEWKIGNSY